MTTIRIKKNKNYSTVYNKPFSNKALSWEARGLLAYLLTKPDDWIIMLGDLVKQGNSKIFKVRRMLKELEQAGHVTRECINAGGGKFKWETTIYENPTVYQLSVDGSSVDGSSVDGKPIDIISNESPSTEGRKKRKNPSPNGKPPVPSKAVKDLEYLETLFAQERGVPLPDWETDPKGAQKTWRTPLKTILSQCHSLEEAEEVVMAAIKHMQDDRLTFTKPIQILETALSVKADRRNGKARIDPDNPPYIEIY